MGTKKVNKISLSLRFFIGFMWLSFWSLFSISLMLICLPFRTIRIRLGNFTGKIIGPFITRIAGTKITYSNYKRISETKPAIYVMNHASALDIFVAMALCPYGGCGIGKKEIIKIPFFGLVYWLSGHLLIDRSNHQKAISSMNELSSFVKKNNLSIWIWPEGTRSLDGKLLPFKKGFAHLAISTGLPIVPVILHDAHKRWPAKTMDFYPGEVKVDILDPIKTKHWNKENLDSHIEEVKGLMAEALM
ncbi:MAG: lysophospholipid acyltransferase family protein [Candidatus Poseidoniia archaeon]|nr:lysophospholipid acyltransferase family protein [Candidatus Poseidoniia archaeon]